MIQRLHIFSLAMLLCAALPSLAQEARPVLQILNGSQQMLDVFWLKEDAERVANGSLAPGQDTTITTTLGHRFALVGREDHTEFTVASEVLVQGVRFDPPSKNGVPAFYTQSVSAGGFPIVASAKVNPFALKEAAYLVEMMLARRPDVRDAMIKGGARMCIIGWDEFTTDLPEFAQMKPKDFWDARARGTGGSATDPYGSRGVAESAALFFAQISQRRSTRGVSSRCRLAARQRARSGDGEGRRVHEHRRI